MFIGIVLALAAAFWFTRGSGGPDPLDAEERTPAAASRLELDHRVRMRAQDLTYAPTVVDDVDDERLVGPDVEDR